MECRGGDGRWAGFFALVTYITGPLGTYLDNLRQELVPSCRAQSHVSILPPRMLPSQSSAEGQLQSELSAFLPFEIELSRIEVFEGTGVIYVSIGSGQAELYRLHNHLNQHALNFREPFQYHPHVTLAQEFPGEQLAALKTLAESRWESYRHSKRFLVETLTFVQGTPGNGWVDLRHFDSVRSAITTRTS